MKLRIRKFNINTYLREGARLAALTAAIAIVVWSMPDHPELTAVERESQTALSR